jgi:hypothetical protein
MQKHAETCCALDIYLHMKIHIQLSTCANTCKHTLNSPYKPTKADKFAALDKSQKCKLMLISSIQASKMRIHAPLCVCGYQPLYALSDTSAALDACRHKQIHDMTSPNTCGYVLSAYTCRHMQSPQHRRQQHCSECTLTNADTYMLRHALLSKSANACRYTLGS